MGINRSAGQRFSRAQILVRAGTPVQDLWSGEVVAWPATQEHTGYCRLQRGSFSHWFFLAADQLWSVKRTRVKVLTPLHKLGKGLPAEILVVLRQLQHPRRNS
jgi:hypothetical protein